MPTTLDAVISFVRGEVNRGNTADAVIPTKILQAIQFVERNGNYKYMEKLQEFDLFANASFEAPYILVDNLKEIRFIRIVDIGLDGAGSYKYLVKKESRDLLGISIGTPCLYSLEGSGHVWFNAIPQTALDMHIGFYQYTGTLAIDQTCWLFDNALDVIIAKTMQLMAPWMRQPQLAIAYQPMLETGLKTLIKATEDERLTTPVRYGESNG